MRQSTYREKYMDILSYRGYPILIIGYFPLIWLHTSHIFFIHIDQILELEREMLFVHKSKHVYYKNHFIFFYPNTQQFTVWYVPCLYHPFGLWFTVFTNDRSSSKFTHIFLAEKTTFCLFMFWNCLLKRASIKYKFVILLGIC